MARDRLEYLSMRIKTHAKQRMTNDFHFSHFPLLTLGFVKHAKKSISGALAHAMLASCVIGRVARPRARTLAKEYDKVWRHKALLCHSLWRCAKVPNSEIFTLLMKVRYL